MLKEQGSHLPIRLAPNNNQWRHESFHGKIPAQLRRVPSLAEGDDDAFPALRVGIDHRLQLAPDGFGWVGVAHGFIIPFMGFDAGLVSVNRLGKSFAC